MKSIILLSYFYLCVCNSCQAQDKEEKKESINPKSMSNNFFDLSNLTLNEDIFDVLNASGLKLEDNQKIDAFTLMGYQKFESTSSKLLLFNGESLSGKNTRGSNNIILYYAEEDNLFEDKGNSLGMYQINIYTKKETILLLNSLKNKFNSAKIYKLGPITTYLWVNNNICYYYFTKDENEDSEDFYRVLFVFNKNKKQWINFIGSLGYSLNLAENLK